jgi:hypothetical protein
VKLKFASVTSEVSELNPGLALLLRDGVAYKNLCLLNASSHIAGDNYCNIP